MANAVAHRQDAFHLLEGLSVMTLPIRILKFLALLDLLAILGGIGAAAFFFGGFFNVAANHPDPDIVNWALVNVRKASIARHATDGPPTPLDEPALVRAGARAYAQSGCTNCHGGPGVEPAKFSDGLNPPPNLKKVVDVLLPKELFWVIKNGIKMTGMPSFGAEDPPVPDQEIWTIVAFLKKLSSVSDEDFKALTATPAVGQ
jgi:mono/diheme cytochrome c family protein